MDIPVTRRLLGRAGKERVLSSDAIRFALDVSGLRPGVAETRAFVIRVMMFAGVLSLAAGIIFLIAFNWQQLGLYGRFAVVEVPLLVALAAAWVKDVDGIGGKLALMLSILLTGALLALFGQTYQTGANVYELFLGWALLVLPWVVACRYAPAWAIWLGLLNLAAGLYASGAHRGLFWFIDRMGTVAWTVPFMLNVLAYVAVEALSFKRVAGFGERWLSRGVMATAMGFGTLIAIIGVVEFRGSTTFADEFPVVLFIGASVALGAYAYRRKEDLFAFAVLALSWVVASTTLLGRFLLEQHAEIGALFLIAVYIIGVSSAAVIGIVRIGRAWKGREVAQ